MLLLFDWSSSHAHSLAPGGQKEFFILLYSYQLAQSLPSLTLTHPFAWSSRFSPMLVWLLVTRDENIFLVDCYVPFLALCPLAVEEFLFQFQGKQCQRDRGTQNHLANRLQRIHPLLIKQLHCWQSGMEQFLSHDMLIAVRFCCISLSFGSGRMICSIFEDSYVKETGVTSLHGWLAVIPSASSDFTADSQELINSKTPRCSSIGFICIFFVLWHGKVVCASFEDITPGLAHSCVCHLALVFCSTRLQSLQMVDHCKCLGKSLNWDKKWPSQDISKQSFKHNFRHFISKGTVWGGLR